MAQNVTIAGASYLGVPRIEMPKTGGGTAVFVDTSDANAAAGDITKGKTAYVGGTKITGTLEASSVSVQDTKAVTITSNGTVSVTPDAPYDALKKVDVTVNVASGGGVEYEECNITLQGYFPAGSFVAYTIFDRGNSGDVHIIPALDTFEEDYEFKLPITNAVLKNSSFFIGGITRDCVATGNIVAVDTLQDGYYSFLVTGDCQITF